MESEHNAYSFKVLEAPLLQHLRLSTLTSLYLFSMLRMYLVHSLGRQLIDVTAVLLLLLLVLFFSEAQFMMVLRRSCRATMVFLYF